MKPSTLWSGGMRRANLSINDPGAAWFCFTQVRVFAQTTLTSIRMMARFGMEIPSQRHELRADAFVTTGVEIVGREASGCRLQVPLGHYLTDTRYRIFISTPEEVVNQAV